MRNLGLNSLRYEVKGLRGNIGGIKVLIAVCFFHQKNLLTKKSKKGIESRVVAIQTVMTNAIAIF